jgi:hypothetical protein
MNLKKILRTVHIVVARYKESLDWLHDLRLPPYAKIFIYNKGDSFPSAPHWSVLPLPNVGQCWGTFMTHMAEFYGQYADCTLFVNGSCMTMDQKKVIFLSLLDDIFKKNYIPQPKLSFDGTDLKHFQLDSWISHTPENRGGLYTTATHRPLGKWWNIHFADLRLPETNYVSHLSTFALSSQQLYQYPQTLYRTLQKELQRSPLQEEAHFLERLVPFIWFRSTSVQLAEDLYRNDKRAKVFLWICLFLGLAIIIFFLFKKN